MNETQTNYVQVTGPISCARCDYSTKDLHDQGYDYHQQQEIFDLHLNKTHPGWQSQTREQFELNRLKEEVVRLALACRAHDQTGFHNNMEVEEYEAAMEKYDILEAAFNSAVDALATYEDKEQG